MAYGKTLKKNFYSDGRGEIAMPQEGEIPPVLADSPQDWAGQQSHPMVQNNTVEEHENVVTELEASNDIQHSDNEQQEEQEELQEVPQQKFKTPKDAENHRALREARERAEWERDTLKAQMQEMQKSLQNQYKPQVQVEEPLDQDNDDFIFDVEDDALLEGKHAKKLVQELKKVKKELRQYHSQTSDTAIEAKIRSSMPDFDQVVSASNVQRLNEEYPEIAQTLKDTPNLFNKASAAYSIMKKFGIHKDMTYEEDKMKAIKNAQKPRPVASVSPQQGDSPLSKANAFANGLTKDLQKKMLEEMNAARRNV